MTIHCATTNSGKLEEFRLAAARFAAGFGDLEPLPGLRDLPPCEETGASFEENAVQKALFYGAHVPGWLFADDSGLEVDALGGAPGIMSARYAGPGAGDADNNRLLLDRMRGVARRKARFVCVVALARNGELAATFRGEVAGLLLEKACGDGGFGYDPLFYYPPLACTLAELDAGRKLSVSHRGRALEQMFRFLADPSTPGNRSSSWRR